MKYELARRLVDLPDEFVVIKTGSLRYITDHLVDPMRWEEKWCVDEEYEYKITPIAEPMQTHSGD